MLPQLTLFGEVLLETPAGSYTLRSGKGAALLVYLAYRGGWVRRESLLALLWPETPEKQARANLRQLLVKLRRLPYLPGLEVTDSSVRWPVATDVAAFGAALAADDFAAAAKLYAGPLSAEFDPAGSGSFGDWLAGERDGLFFAFRSAALSRAQELRRRSAVEELAAVLGELLRHDPFDEDVLCERLSALMEAGRYRQALAAYEAFRARLRRELDAAPGKATRELVARVRIAEARKASGPSEPSLTFGRRATDVPATAPLLPDIDAPEPATPVLSAPSLTLRASSAFVGRRQERDAVQKCLADPACRLLTLVGPGGVGKTRLAVELSAVTEGFPGGVVMVPLEAVSDVQLLAPTLAACLGLSLDAPETPEQQVIAHLSGRTCLLILDNFEQLLAGKAFLLTLLARAPGVKLLLTTRERLGVPEEVPLELRGLSLEGEGSRPADAVALFLHGARRVGVTLRRESDLQHAADICALVEGVPLALELTSAWLRLLTPAEVKTELSAGLDLLVAPDTELPERHRNMRLVLGRSWARLEVDEQRTLARLSVFRGGFPYTAAKAVTGMSLSVLLALVHKSLLYRAADGRFTLHELVRQYADEQLTAEGVLEQVSAEHARYYLGLLGTLEMWSDHEAASLAVLDGELSNLRAAWRWAVPSGRLPEFWVQNDAVIFFDRRMRFLEGLDFFEAISACFDPADPAYREALANLRIDRAWLLFRLSRYAEAEALAGDSLDAVLSTKTRMKAFNTLGIVTRQQGHYEAAVGHIEGALALARELGEVARIAAYLNNLGATCITLGEYERAAEASRAALNLHRASEDTYGVVTTLLDLSNIYSAQNAYERALKATKEGLELAREQGFDDVTPVLLLTRAQTLYQLEDLPEAEGAALEVLSLMTESGKAWDKMMVLNLLGCIATQRGQPAQARRYLMNAFILAWQHKDMPTVLETMVAVAELELAEGEHKRAYKLLRAVLRHPSTSAIHRRAAEQLLGEFTEQLAEHPIRYFGEADPLPLEHWVPAFFGLEGKTTNRKLN